MKILVKNKKWNISFQTKVLICDIKESNGIFSIYFQYNGNNITIKSKNIDNTLKYLDEIFKQETKKIKENF
ncbi:MAG: hypothetical protein WCQ76_05525 [Fusobacterium sp.]